MRFFEHIAVAAMLFASGVVGSAPARDLPVPVNISAQSLGDALNQLATQTGLQLIFNVEELTPQEVRVPAIKGMLTPEDALKALLANTRLQYKFIDSRTVALSAENGKETAVESAALPVERMAQSGGAAYGSSTDSTSSNDAQLEEIVVTAQKRIERLQDVPVPVTAISADRLVSSNQLRLQEYFDRVPGLNVAPDEFGTPTVIIRGITTGGFTNPTVGVVIDDVPYGGATVAGDGKAAPDIDPTDLTRVEVLRGPQGTLYGASSLGGLLKYVTVSPSTDAVSGEVQGSINSVRNGDDVGYHASGALNIPLSSGVAIRGSVFTRQDAGFIDNPGLGTEGVNQGKTDGGRVSALWKPSGALSLRINALYQDQHIDGSPLVTVLPGVGDLEQQFELQGYGGHVRETQAYDATLTAHFGTFDLTAVSGYNINRHSDTGDLGFTLAGDDHFRTTKLSQEIRLATPIGAKVDWLAGAFYSDADTTGRTRYFFVDPPTGDITSTLFDSVGPFSFTEYALFTDFIFHLTNRFDLQVGGRESENHQRSSSVSTGPLVGGLQIAPELKTDDNAFTYLFTPKLKLTDDLMLYGRVASGYRPGGPNLNTGQEFVPIHYGPDKTVNYELGMKGNVLNHALSFDASLYYIDWKNIQLQILSGGGIGYIINASRAKSQGVEFSADARPLRGLAVSAWMAWNEAELTEDFPPLDQGGFAQGFSGDRLPNSARFSGSFSLDQEFPFTAQVTGFVGGSVSYIGNRIGLFRNRFVPSPAERQSLPGFAKTDLRAGARYESWTVNLFANNVTDKRGMLSGGLGTTYSTGFNFIQPRTIGLAVSKTF
jgi:outer membrane receptor protein involved in Fe transport